MQVYAHRCAAGEAPENTVAACRHAIERGARYLELDLRLSADGQLVVIHDKKVDRTTYDRGPVDNFTTKELAAMDARRSGPPWPRKRGAGIPTLNSILDATPEIKGYYLEVKSDVISTMEDIASLLAERIGSRHILKRVVVTSMDRHALHTVRDLAPRIPIGFISTLTDARAVLDEFKLQHLLLHWSACHPGILRHARNMGVSVAAWTVNDPQIIKALYRLKVDSVITDYPSMALPTVASLMR